MPRALSAGRRMRLARMVMQHGGALLIWLATSLTLSSRPGCAKSLAHPTIILLSFDGFRHDFIDKYDLRRFRQLGEAGVWSTGLRPVFVTKTFPNHFTIVTGLYEESHGVVSNIFFDPLYNDTFAYSSDSKWWNSSVPIWITNELNLTEGSLSEGQWASASRKRKSATVMWPGSDVPYLGRRPFFDYEPNNASLSTKSTFEQVFRLISAEDPPNFIACHFAEPDNTSHEVGTDHPQLRVVLRNLDYLLGQFLDRLKEAGLLSQINLILVSDHGMADITGDRVIAIDDYVDLALVELTYYGTILLVRPLAGQKMEVYKRLLAVPHLKTFLKEDIPESVHYKNNRRVPEVFALAEEGYYFVPSAKEKAVVNKTFGDHGYNDSLMSMHGLFIAHGPNFQERTSVGIIRNIDLYEMMCHILKILPHPNNGSLDLVSPILREDEPYFFALVRKPVFVISLVAMVTIVLALVLVICLYKLFKKRSSKTSYARIDDRVPLAEYVEDDDDVDIYNNSKRSKRTP